MKTSNTKLLATAAILSLTLLGSIRAHAEGQQQDSGTAFSPVVEISAGAELNQVGTSAPCTSGCGVAQHGTDTRTSPNLRFGFKGVDLMQLISSQPGVNHVSFLPISMILDTGVLVLRGKLARIEYDRDKGIFDWRALDASVGIQSSVAMG